LQFEDFMESAEYLVQNNKVKLDEFFIINVDVIVNKVSIKQKILEYEFEKHYIRSIDSKTKF
jgi:hypothetical protein